MYLVGQFTPAPSVYGGTISFRRRDLLYFPLGSLVVAFQCGQLGAILLGFGYLMKFMVLSAPLSILLFWSAILHYSLNHPRRRR